MGDIKKVRNIVRELKWAETKGTPYKLPKGGILTVEVFQSVGILFGLATGLETVHYLVEDAFDTGAPTTLSHEFLCGVERVIGLDEAPLYLLLHESIYCSGGSSEWACQRARELRENKKHFDARPGDEEEASGTNNNPVPVPVLFTGEMMFPWMLTQLSVFCDSPVLQNIGKELANRE